MIISLRLEMDEPEEIINPFDLREILIQLLLHVDRGNYQRLYQSNKELMDSSYFLEKLQEHYHLPFQPSSFYDFVFERDLRDPIDRKNLCMTPKRMLIYAVKSNDPALVRSLLDDGAPTEEITFFLAGEMGNPKILDQLVYSNAYLKYLKRILEGLAYGSHNQLLQIYLQIDPTIEQGSIVRAAAKGGNLALVMELYSPKTRSVAINGATVGGHPEIVEWIFKQAPQDEKDSVQVCYGAIESGNMELITSIWKKRLSARPDDFLDSVIKSNNPEIFDWILTEVLRRRLYTVYDMSLEECCDKMRAPKIVKRFLERYDELNPIMLYTEIMRPSRLLRRRRGSYLDAPDPNAIVLDIDVRKFLNEIALQEIQAETALEIIRIAEETYGINHKIPIALKDIYDEKWIRALKASVEVDDIELAKWIIDKFHPIPELLRGFAKDSQGCTAEWVLRNF